MQNYNQLVIDFNNKLNNYFVLLNYNYIAYKFLFNKDWLFNVVLLYGEKCVGKTSMLKELAKSNGYFINLTESSFATLQDIVNNYDILIVEDIDCDIELKEELLFALYNLVVQCNKKLIFTSRKKLVDIKINLLDLNTRLQSAVFLEINYPSNNEVNLILKKILSDNQINLEESIINYILEVSNYNLEVINSIIYGVLNYIKHNKKSPSKKDISNLLNLHK